MRNLKRALSLALASVMLLGMMVVGASAASYPDVSAEDNVEAIEVLNAVNVMIGDRGNFRPDAAVNRHEMAVIMAKLYLGSEAADAYVGSHPFTDVFPWADKYVAACYENNLISGTSSTTFSGNRPLTAVQAALMMLRALGYEDLNKGASDWRVPVTAAANRIRLFEGVASNPKDELTRNQVAQLALNTLKSTMVDTKDNSLNISGGSGDNAFTITGGGGREYIVRASADARVAAAISDVESDGSGANGVGGYTLELGEHLYNGDLRLNDGDIDDYGRPARTWEYDGKAVGTYAKTELLRKSYTTKVTGADMYNLLGNSMVTDDKYSLDVFVDGWKYDPDTTSNTYEKFTKANFTRTNEKTMDNTGRGVLTEVFVDTRTKEITVSITNTFLAKALSDYNVSRETLRIEVYYPSAQVSHTLDVEDFPEIASVKEDDFMLVQWVADARDNRNTYADYSVVDILDAEVLTDRTVTRFSTGNNGGGGRISSVVSDGKTYDANKKLYYDNGTLDAYNVSHLTSKTYNIYLDQYGNAIGVDLFSGTDNYVFITGFDLNGKNTAAGDATANAIFLDGTMQSIAVNVRDTDKNIRTVNASTSPAGTYREWSAYPANDMYGAKMNTWYKYTQNENTKVYTLEPVDKDRQFATAVGNGTAKDGNGDYAIKSSSLRLNGNNYGEIAYGTLPAAGLAATTAVSRAYGDQNSVFITVGTSDDTKIGNQYYVIDEVKSVYTGVQNVNIQSDDIKYNSGTGANGDASGVAEPSIYALIDGKDYIIGAIIIGKDTGSTDNYAYIYEKAQYEERASDGTYYWGYSGIVNGERTELKVKSEYPAAVTTIRTVLDRAQNDAQLTAATAAPYGYDTGYLFRLSFDKDGYVVAAETFETGVVESTTSAHNDYIYAVTGSDWDISSDGEIVRYAKVKADTDNEGSVLVIDRNGLTLYNNDEANDKGLAVREDAKITIIQGHRGSRRISEATGLKEAWDYLVDFYDDDTTTADDNDKNFAGTISAVLDTSGRAVWVVFDSKGGTVPGQNTGSGSGAIGNVRVEVINSAGGAPAVDAQIKAMSDGSFVFKNSDTTSLSALPGGWATGVQAEDVIFFKATQASDTGAIRLAIYDDKGQNVYVEDLTGATANGGCYFYIQATRTSSTVFGGNAGTGITAPLSSGTYTWVISGIGVKEPVTGTFTIG